ncbi:MAG: NAD(P)-dependent oxidoreductase [Pseudomonadales bacterium]|nr:NAD(P)-dependent oxidoreductase [Pseudomonadales bacterium]
MPSIGLLHPGAMGASVGAAAVATGHRVYWASDGRSEATGKRASRARLEDARTVDTIVARCEIILSVCPPHSAEEVAQSVVDAGFKGLYLEGNAIAPARARRIADLLTSHGATMVDGGIIGGPAWHADAGTTLHLSGDSASRIAQLFAGSPLATNIVSKEIGAASALKMVFAAYTKGSTALLSAILGVAEREGVRGALEAQWGEKFTRETHARVTGNTSKAWRFVGEMEEIAATFADADFDDGFHRAAADTFNRLARFKDAPASSIEAVLEALLSR